jgi:hypothetical protein
MQYQRISADCHLDMIWLPPDLFTSGAARALKDEMPHRVESGCGAVAVGWAYLFPPLSSGGALVAQP